MRKRATLGDLARITSDAAEKLFETTGDRQAGQAVRDLRQALRSGQLADAITELRRLKRAVVDPAKPKFYVATALENAARADLIADALVGKGFEQTYRWSVHGSVYQDGPVRMREVAERELQGVLDADLVLVMLPGGRGTHAEIGAALGQDKPVVLWAESEAQLVDERGQTCAFYNHPNVTRSFVEFERLPGAVAEIYKKLAEQK